jgi:spore germination protein Q
MMNNPYKAGTQTQPQMPYGYTYPTYQGAYPGGYQPPVSGAPTYMPTNQPTGSPQVTGAPTGQAGAYVPGQLPLEESYIENILRLNLGKMATIYMTFENNSEWNAKIFKGRLEAAGRDHIIISDPSTGMRYLLLMVNLDYITFDQELQYLPSYGGAPTSR